MSKSLAIAYSMKRKKRAAAKEGGDKGVHSGYPQESKKGKSVAGELVRDAKEAPTKEKWANKNELAKILHEQKLEELKEDKTDRKYLAEGGDTMAAAAKKGQMSQGQGMGFDQQAPGKPAGPVSEEEAKKFKAGAGFASGGEVTCPHCTKTFSHGGQVANDDHPKAGSFPNEFDDLVLRDDEEIGDPIDDDLIGRVMAKRKAKKA